ncbi:MAG: alpha/beta hydrolase [Planctomycetota bacterium]
MNRTLLLVLTTWPLLTGCFAYKPASGPTLEPRSLGADAWPRFDTEPLEPLLETPREIVRYTVDEPRVRAGYEDLDPAEVDALLAYMERGASTRVDPIRMTRHGLLRVWDEPERAKESTRVSSFFGGMIEEFVANGSYLTADELAWQRARRQSQRDHGQRTYQDEPSSGLYGAKATGEIERWELEQGLALGMPVGDLSQAPGLILHITSLIENTWEHETVRRLQSHGWAVAHIRSNTGVRGPNAVDRMRRFDLQRQRADELNSPFNREEARRIAEGGARAIAALPDILERLQAHREQARAEHPDIGTGFEIMPDTDIPALARLIAESVDRRLAAHAYAAEALVDTIDQKHPELADRPVVVMGFSAGAIVAPTVAARLHEQQPDRSVLLVMIGGGGDVLTISRESRLTNGGLVLDPAEGPEPTPEQICRLYSEYTAHAKLDPVRSALAIRSLPVLHIYAADDDIVPTAAAERLNVAHGRVDRLVHAGNHGTLFYFVSGQAGKIRSWLRMNGAADPPKGFP